MLGQRVAMLEVQLHGRAAASVVCTLSYAVLVKYGKHIYIFSDHRHQAEGPSPPSCISLVYASDVGEGCVMAQ